MTTATPRPTHVSWSTSNSTGLGSSSAKKFPEKQSHNEKGIPIHHHLGGDIDNDPVQLPTLTENEYQLGNNTNRDNSDSDGRDCGVNPSISTVTLSQLQRNISAHPTQAPPPNSEFRSTSIPASAPSQLKCSPSPCASSSSLQTHPPSQFIYHTPSRNLSTSYTRGPNPPITTMTRHRRVSSSGPPSSDSSSNNINAVYGNGNGNDVSISGVGVSAGPGGSGRASRSSTNLSSGFNPNFNGTTYHAMPTPPTRPSTDSSLPHSSSGFNITPAAANVPSSSKKNSNGINTPPVTRPSTGTTERETFSSPPMFTRNWSFYNASGVSGISTPRESLAFSRASSALALTAHVPGLAGLGGVQSTPGDETPDDSNGDEYGDDANINPFIQPGEVFKTEDDGGLRTKTYLLQGEVDKPWLKKKDWREPTSWWITFSMIMLGIAASAAVCWVRWNSVLLLKEPLCMVMQDDFDTFSVDHDGATWMREVDMSGFGNGEFEMTTNFDNNSFVKDGKLYIMPTLTSLAIGSDNVFDGFTYNITGCTNTDNFEGTACGAVSNKTSGTVINPVMSARLTTAKSHSIRYGRIDIRAKLPKGDWLWPALWMLPKDNAYGPWPLSGEIDIMESRGNDLRYPGQGNNVVKGSLNWGPTVLLNSAWRTFGFWFDRRRSFADDFHIYTLEWSPDFIRTSVDSRLHKMLELRFNEPFFTRGQFPPVIQNGSQTIALQNPWFGRPNSAPFDQPFYLIMNVAVGGTSGWFPDNVADKPWLDNSATAMRDFARNQDTWYSTWPESPEDRAMIIDYVKMWEAC